MGNKQNKELEFSFIAPEETIMDIMKAYWHKHKETIRLVDVYYDTEDNLLQKNKYILRIRHDNYGEENEKTVMCLKTPTKVENGIPTKLEIESEDYVDVYNELFKLVPETKDKKFVQTQKRMVLRTIIEFSDFEMDIDNVHYYDNGCGYYNLELEFKGKDINFFVNFKERLLADYPKLREWSHGKLIVGLTAKKFGWYETLDMERLDIIDKFLKGSESK